MLINYFGCPLLKLHIHYNTSHFPFLPPSLPNTNTVPVLLQIRGPLFSTVVTVYIFKFVYSYIEPV